MYIQYIISYLTALFAFFLWSTLGLVVNKSTIPTEVLVGIGSTIALGVLFFIMMVKKEFSQKPHPLLLFLAFLAGCKGLVWFSALRMLPIADAMLIHNIAPLIAMALSTIFLKEKPSYLQLLGIPVGLSGLFFILAPQVNSAQLSLIGILFALLASLASGTQDIIQRRLATVHSPLMQTFFFIFGQTLGGLVFLHPNSLQNMHWADTPIFMYFGIAGTIVPMALLSFSFTKLRAYEVAILGYIEPLFGALWGTLFLGQSITPTLVVGGFCIILAGLSVSKR